MLPFDSVDEFHTFIKNNSPQDDQCRIKQIVQLLSGKWELKILYQLLRNDTVRFGEFKKEIPEITNTMLTSTLRKFESSGLVERKQYNEIPPHVEYYLKDNGKQVAELFYELGKWTYKYLEE